MDASPGCCPFSCGGFAWMRLARNRGPRATAARYAPRSGSSSTIPDRCRRSTGMSTRSGGRSAPAGRCWRGLGSGAGAGGLRCEWLSATACRLRVHGGMRRPAAGCVERAFPGVVMSSSFIWWASVSVLEIRLASRSCVGRITDPSRIPCGSVVR